MLIHLIPIGSASAFVFSISLEAVVFFCLSESTQGKGFKTRGVLRVVVSHRAQTIRIEYFQYEQHWFVARFCAFGGFFTHAFDDGAEAIHKIALRAARLVFAVSLLLRHAIAENDPLAQIVQMVAVIAGKGIEVDRHFTGRALLYGLKQFYSTVRVLFHNVDILESTPENDGLRTCARIHMGYMCVFGDLVPESHLLDNPITDFVLVSIIPVLGGVDRTFIPILHSVVLPVLFFQPQLMTKNRRLGAVDQWKQQLLCCFTHTTLLVLVYQMLQNMANRAQRLHRMIHLVPWR